MDMRYLFDLFPDEARVRHICDNDARFAQLAQTIGTLTISKRENVFEALAKSLIGQQLSVKAAATIIQRVVESCGGLTPESVLLASEEQLRAAGVSKPKIGYIKGLAERIERNELDFDSFCNLENEEVLEALTSIKGIGRWTAEMFLIFYLGREDVLSLGDAGLRRAAHWLYEKDPKTAPDLLEVQGERWKPYRSVASLYLWEAINRGHVAAGPFRELI